MSIKYLSWRFSYASIQAGTSQCATSKYLYKVRNVTLDHTTCIGNHKAAFALLHPNLPNPTFRALSKHLLLSYIPNSLTMQHLSWSTY